jgi:uncharacterized membrane protein
MGVFLLVPLCFFKQKELMLISFCIISVKVSYMPKRSCISKLQHT